VTLSVWDFNFCDHPLQGCCFDIFVTGVDELEQDQMVGGFTFSAVLLLHISQELIAKHQNESLYKNQ
jgi:hypothetical protein